MSSSTVFSIQVTQKGKEEFIDRRESFTFRGDWLYPTIRDAPSADTCFSKTTLGFLLIQHQPTRTCQEPLHLVQHQPTRTCQYSSSDGRRLERVGRGGGRGGERTTPRRLLIGDGRTISPSFWSYSPKRFDKSSSYSSYKSLKRSNTFSTV